jgi:hypothetical protein
MPFLINKVLNSKDPIYIYLYSMQKRRPKVLGLKKFMVRGLPATSKLTRP